MSFWMEEKNVFQKSWFHSNDELTVYDFSSIKDALYAITIAIATMHLGSWILLVYKIPKERMLSWIWLHIRIVHCSPSVASIITKDSIVNHKLIGIFTSDLVFVCIKLNKFCEYHTNGVVVLTVNLLHMFFICKIPFILVYWINDIAASLKEITETNIITKPKSHLKLNQKMNVAKLSTKRPVIVYKIYMFVDGCWLLMVFLFCVISLLGYKWANITNRKIFDHKNSKQWLTIHRSLYYMYTKLSNPSWKLIKWSFDDRKCYNLFL